MTEGATEAISSVPCPLPPSDAALLYPTPAFGLYGTYGQTPRRRTHRTGHLSYRIRATRIPWSKHCARFKAATPYSSSTPPTPPASRWTTLNWKALADVGRTIRRHRGEDEVYAEITYGSGRAPSISSYAPERTIVVDSTSKAFAMTGWRLGYFAAPHSQSIVGKPGARVHCRHIHHGCASPMNAETTKSSL